MIPRTEISQKCPPELYMSILRNALVTYTADFLPQEVADRYFDVFNATFPFRYNNYN